MDAPETWPGKDAIWSKADPLAVDMVLLQLKARLARDPAAAFLARQMHEAHPSDPRPFEILGAVALLEDRVDLALDHWRSAAERGSRNGFVHLVSVEKELGTWLDGGRLNQRIPASMAARIREQLSEARKWNVAQRFDDYWTLWLEAFAAESDSSRIDEIRSRINGHPKGAEMRLALAVWFHRCGRESEAKTLVEELLLSPPDRRTDLLQQLAAAYEMHWTVPAERKPAIRFDLSLPRD